MIAAERKAIDKECLNLFMGIPSMKVQANPSHFKLAIEDWVIVLFSNALRFSYSITQELLYLLNNFSERLSVLLPGKGYKSHGH
jgi:hypothetical protein